MVTPKRFVVSASRCQARMNGKQCRRRGAYKYELEPGHKTAEGNFTVPHTVLICRKCSQYCDVMRRAISAACAFSNDARFKVPG